MNSRATASVMKNQLMDSTVWEDFNFRTGDVIIATYSKTGTTWTQQIVGQILRGPDPDLRVHDVSPWLDFVLSPKQETLQALEAQSHRRFIKTHLPAQALKMSDQARYIYVARDGRDTCWSLHNHFLRLTADLYEAINDRPDRVGLPIERPAADVRQYFVEWLQNGHPTGSFWDHIRSWWRLRDRPNVKLIHYSTLKRDMAGMMREIAEFLDEDVDPTHWPEIEHYCSFDWMKMHARRVTPGDGALWEGGAETFIHKGVNGRWRDVLTQRDVAEYEARARAELGTECAAWLAQH